MQEEVLIRIRHSQIEQARFAGNDEVEAPFVGCFFEAGHKFFAFFFQNFRAAEFFHFFQASFACRKRSRAHPVAAGVADGGSRAAEFLFAAKCAYVVSVGESFAEADEVCVEAVVTVAAPEVETEAASYVVDDENDAFFVANFSDCLPVARFRQNVVGEVAVHVRSCDERRDFAFVFSDDLFETFDIVESNHEVVADVFVQSAGQASF